MNMHFLNTGKNNWVSTHLWTGNLGSGNFILNTPYSNFDMIIYNVSRDDYNDLALTYNIITPGSHSLYPGNLLELSIANPYWRGSYSGDYVTFSTSSEKSRLRNVYGVKFITPF